MSAYWPNLIPILFVAPYLPWTALARAVRATSRRGGRLLGWGAVRPSLLGADLAGTDGHDRRHP